MSENENFIPSHGGYKTLLAYKKSEIVYDATVFFCSKYISKRDRTYDQMVQAARSGKQNIAEGSMASGTSKQTEIKLVNVARASLEELLLDYQDYLRTNRLELWEKNSKAVRAVRNLTYKQDESYETYRPYIEERSAGTAVNVIICLIHQTNYLLDKLIRKLESDFIKNGGMRERMYQARTSYRNRSHKEEKN